jgi:Ca2+-binding EF-hand superfamily protein
MAYVQGLSGPLSHLNGAVCEPRLLPTGQVVADVKHKSGTIQFAGKAKFFAPFQTKAKRRVSAEPLTPSKGGPTINMNNRSSVGVAFSSICLEIMRAINQRAKNPNEILRAFDRNGDGAVDQDELLVSSQKLGLSISIQQIEMVWAMFDPSPETNNINIHSFMQAVKRSASLKKSSAGKHQQAVAHRQATKLEREKRIQQKSIVIEVMTKLSTGLQQELHTLMEAQNLSVKALFLELDLEKSGKINMIDFRSSLKNYGIFMTKEEIQLLWPSICQKRYGPSYMTLQEFSDYVSADDCNISSFKYVDDQVVRELFKDPSPGSLFQCAPPPSILGSSSSMPSLNEAKSPKRLPKLTRTISTPTMARRFSSYRTPPYEMARPLSMPPLDASPAYQRQPVQPRQRNGSQTVQLLESPASGKRLMPISGIRKSDAAEEVPALPKLYQSSPKLSSRSGGSSRMESPKDELLSESRESPHSHSRSSSALDCAAESKTDIEKKRRSDKCRVSKTRPKAKLSNTASRLHMSGPSHQKCPAPKKTEVSFRFQGVDVVVSEKVLRRLQKAKSAAMVRDIISHAVKKPP